jgi:UDP-N-acetylglucosamine:LPS N-acetylglucosamine transferase
MTNYKKSERRIMAISSGGGHWIQLLRLRPAFEGHQVVFVTVDDSYHEDVPGSRFRVIPDATRWSKVALLYSAIRILWALLLERPDVIVSTGAAPGFLALRLGRYLGARTVWLDSIANADELSLSGQKIGRYADLWLTQWSHLDTKDGPFYKGSVL